MAEEMVEQFDVVCAGEIEEAEGERAEAEARSFQVIIKLENQHGVGVGGKVYARIGVSKTVSQLIAVLPGKTKTFDFRTSSGTITRIWSDELACGHSTQHVFRFTIPDPKNGYTYSGKVT